MNGHPVIFFDGVCNLCNGMVHFLLKRDRKGVLRFVSLQSDMAKTLLGPKFPEAHDTYFSVVLMDTNHEVYLRSEAILRMARYLGPPWSWAYIFRLLPLSFRDAVYHLIAKNRYRLFGKRDTCAIAPPEWRERFLDA